MVLTKKLAVFCAVCVLMVTGAVMTVDSLHPTAPIATTGRASTSTQTSTLEPASTSTPTSTPEAVPTAISTSMPGSMTASSMLNSNIPSFDHIILILFENRSYKEVIGSKKMPFFNQLASQNVLLTHYFAVTHPSLPNYIALIGGDTYGIKTDCTDCFVNHTSLPDLIEASGRTWKTYQESMPSPCKVGSSGKYAQRHNPFVYFDPIRTDKARCQQHVVSLTQLDKDLAANQLPNFVFIMPNLCNSAHDCSISTADKWLKQTMGKLQASPALGQNYLIYIGFDEGNDNDTSSCCGLPKSAGGQTPVILISPQAKSGYRDATPLTHYSLLKTISIAWKLPELGNAALPTTTAITAPWK